MRVLLISHAADKTGAPISALLLARALVAMGIDIQIVLRRNGPLSNIFSDVAPTHQFRPNPKFGTKDILSLALRDSPVLAARCLRNPDRPFCLSTEEDTECQNIRHKIQAWKPDLIYANTTHSADVVHYLNLSIPVVTHVRELQPTISALDSRRRTIALRKSDLLLAASKRCRSDLISHFNVPSNLIAVEPPAIEIPDVFDIDQQRDSVRTNYGLQPNDRLIVGAGTVGHRKGADLFLLAAKEALQTYRGKGRLKFIWLGEGEWRTQMVKEIQEAGLTQQIQFPGAEECPLNVFRQSVAIVCPSREDTYPRVLIEAAATGTHGFCFAHTGGAEEFLSEFDAGVAVQSDSPKLLGASVSDYAAQWTGPDSSLTSRISEQFSVQLSATRVVALFSRLLGARTDA
jgi:glycosyltransferase involved in cell wall biosynthesis